MSLSSLITLMWYMIVWQYINGKKKKRERKLKQNQINIKVGGEQGTKVDDE